MLKVTLNKKNIDKTNLIEIKGEQIDKKIDGKIKMRLLVVVLLFRSK